MAFSVAAAFPWCCVATLRPANPSGHGVIFRASLVKAKALVTNSQQMTRVCAHGMPGQKKILVGMIKDLGTKSRAEMKKFLGCNVHLFLKVKLTKSWTESSSGMYERLGLDFNA